MIILSWNARGLNGASHQKDIQDLIGVHSLDIFCVQETKLQLDFMLWYAPHIWFFGQC